MSTGTLCSRIVATASGIESVRLAADRMTEHDVGTLVVLDGTADGRPIGVLTDRDITVRVTAEGRNPAETTIAEIMSTPVHSVGEYTSVEEALARMARVGVRRLVVTGDNGQLVGIFSLDDALDFLARHVTAIGQLLVRQQPKILT